MDSIEASAVVRGAGRQELADGPWRDSTVTATAMTDSEGGFVWVNMGGSTVTDGGTQWVQVPTTFEVRKGELVRVTKSGAEGHGRPYVVTGVIGAGDRTRKAVDAATSKAEGAATKADEASEAARKASEEARRAAEDVSKAVSAADAATKAAGEATGALAPIRADVDAMRRDAKAQADAIEGVKSDVTDHYSAQRETAALVAEHSTSIKQTAARLETVVSRSEELSADVSAAKSAADRAQEQLKAAQSALDSLKENAQATDAQVSKAVQAVEDAKAAVDKAAKDITDLSARVTTAESRVTQNAGAIAAEVSARRQVEHGMEALSATLSVTAESVTATAKALDERMGEVSRWQRFSSDGMSIGRDGSDFETRISERELDFTYKGATVASATADGFSAPVMEAGTLRMGGRWAWVTMPDGSLDLKWIG